MIKLILILAILFIILLVAFMFCALKLGKESEEKKQ